MPTTAHSLDNFHAWSPAHGAVIIAAIIVSIAAIALRRALGRRLDPLLAILTAALWLIIQILQFIRDEFPLNTALPLHVSDLTLAAVPVALWMSWRWARAIVCCWGVAVCTLAFIMPDLRDGPARLGFWLFWGTHVTILAAAVYDAVGRGYRPGWRDFATASISATIYALVILPFDALTKLNYGYIGPDQPSQPAALRYFGPWPWRAAAMLLTAIAAMFVVTWLARKLPHPHANID